MLMLILIHARIRMMNDQCYTTTTGVDTFAAFCIEVHTQPKARRAHDPCRAAALRRKKANPSIHCNTQRDDHVVTEGHPVPVSRLCSLTPRSKRLQLACTPADRRIFALFQEKARRTQVWSACSRVQGSLFDLHKLPIVVAVGAHCPPERAHGREGEHAQERGHPLIVRLSAMRAQPHRGAILHAKVECRAATG